MQQNFLMYDRHLIYIRLSLRGDAGYKTIYLRQSVIDAVEKIAKDNQTSFNNVVVSMIERCLEEERES